MRILNDDDFLRATAFMDDYARQYNALERHLVEPDKLRQTILDYIDNGPTPKGEAEQAIDEAKAIRLNSTIGK